MFWLNKVFRWLNENFSELGPSGYVFLYLDLLSVYFVERTKNEIGLVAFTLKKHSSRAIGFLYRINMLFIVYLTKSYWTESYVYWCHLLYGGKKYFLSDISIYTKIVTGLLKKWDFCRYKYFILIFMRLVVQLILNNNNGTSLLQRQSDSQHMHKK